MIILIPAYEPDDKLVDLIDNISLADDHVQIVVVNDGSGAQFDPIFRQVESRGVTVIGHMPNRGKGYSLKQGFAHIAVTYPGDDVVCADSDGQHRVADILRVGAAISGHANTMVLGARGFTGYVPFKSRFGNALTRLVFRISTGVRVVDTQTGLRAYPSTLLGWLASVEGDRFEYETSVLLQAAKDGIRIDEVMVDTVYTEGNASTHFRPVVDSVRVYAPLLKFSMSSLAAFVLDFVLLVALKGLTHNLLVSVVAARAVSSVFNFAANRRLVFNHGRGASMTSSACRYFSLVATIMAINFVVLHVLHERLGVGLAVSKLGTEIALFAVSYWAQSRFVFIKPQQPHSAPTDRLRSTLG